jgi:predicted hydrocarbon binding protein
MSRDKKAQVPQIKGVAMLNCIRALRSLDKERARELLPPAMHKYLENERILAVAWYPESEMLELNRALAQLMRPTLRGASLEETYVHMGYLVGGIDLAKMYASLQRGGLDSELVQKMAAGWKQYHDTGSLIASVEPQQVRFELRDYGLPTQELCWIQRGWFVAYLERAAGAEHVTVVESQCRQRGAHSCIWQGSWV